MKKFIIAGLIAVLGTLFSGIDIAHARSYSSGGYRSTSSFSRSWSRPSYSPPRTIYRSTTVYRGSKSNFGSSFAGSLAGSAVGTMVGNSLSRPSAQTVVSGPAPVMDSAGAGMMVAPQTGVPATRTNGWDVLNNLIGAIVFLGVLLLLAVGGFLFLNRNKL